MEHWAGLRAFYKRGNDRGDDMITDTALWIILVAMFGWVACGCYVTRHQLVRERYDHGRRDSGD